jgi:hypothetical protein
VWVRHNQRRILGYWILDIRLFGSFDDGVFVIRFWPSVDSVVEPLLSKTLIFDSYHGHSRSRRGDDDIMGHGEKMVWVSRV